MKAHPTTTYHLVTPATWELVRAAYLSGLSAPTVCARFGVSVPALRKRARRQGWTKAAYAARDPVAAPYGPAAAASMAAAPGVAAPASPAAGGPVNDLPQMLEGLPPLDVNPAALARKALSDAAYAMRYGRPREARAYAQAAEAIARMNELIPYATPCDDDLAHQWRLTALRSAIHEMAVQIAEGIAKGEPIPATYTEAAEAWLAKKGMV
ncbi:hypothetical protein [Caulobacter sp. NIBR2454]|uniref:hypothetical protein n=1 Tax=Caulobacter sp. NIBR2454 TaxID=3015996 RepID=UPI0022B68A2A|nr:hypothetical protein [Caulobacter sp. NIBR2454]